MELTNSMVWAGVRMERATLMNDVDKLVNEAEDKGIDAAPFRQYRQALRDIPQTFSDPEKVVWPTKPLLPSASV